MPLSPKRVIHSKVHFGWEKDSIKSDNTIDFGDIALVVMESTWLDTRVIDTARVAIKGKLEPKCNVWIGVFQGQLQRSLIKLICLRVPHIIGQMLSNLVCFCLRLAELILRLLT